MYPGTGTQRFFRSRRRRREREERNARSRLRSTSSSALSQFPRYTFEENWERVEHLSSVSFFLSFSLSFCFPSFLPSFFSPKSLVDDQTFTWLPKQTQFYTLSLFSYCLLLIFLTFLWFAYMNFKCKGQSIRIEAKVLITSAGWVVYFILFYFFIFSAGHSVLPWELPVPRNFRNVPAWKTFCFEINLLEGFWKLSCVLQENMAKSKGRIELQVSVPSNYFILKSFWRSKTCSKDHAQLWSTINPFCLDF